MHTSRLRIVSDICPMSGNDSLCPSGTRWQGNVAPSTSPIIWHNDGYTATVLRTPILTWYRTFTANNTPPAELPRATSLLTLHEWIPTSMPTHFRGWKHISAPDLAAVTFLEADYAAKWSEQARRHLRTFRRSTLRLELGTLEDVDIVNKHSQVPRGLQDVFRNVVKRHLATQPNTLDFLIAKSHDGTPCAAFVAGNCDEIQQSTYLVGCFDPAFAKDFPMVGLVDWWFQRSLERGYRSVNFGDIVPPRPLPSFLEHGIGYSLFKTHFNIHRVNLPGCFWKIMLR
ncbi:MAG: hypothetical protein UY72_C0002G0006 [Candidatus Uhrbacteria bacterium GW2011_GWD2_52_7]|uniref:BioF2-like acetyltransferase domain-containing protein n=1 Tax=Candidatus Uhrbacteria bacterium GW2011_GWD2_52_7 TaxID=1618989 RepID=A0A0G1XIQ1_9BACT|nr:MAG: hypothetical protein UY72_C0002G0006 [Candidatus Uhrbacteria bacterium GW2011_GWD2_52_7]